MQKHSTDDGFSLVEVIIALFLLGVISLAVLPLTIAATQLSVQNRDTLAATAFAKERLAVVRSSFPDVPGDSAGTCARLDTLLAAPAATDPDNGFTAVLSAEACPATYPGSVPVTVTVNMTDGGEQVTTVTTVVRLGAES